MGETLTYEKAGVTTHILPDGVAAYSLEGVNKGTAKDKQPKEKRKYTLRNRGWVTWGDDNKFPEHVMTDLRKSTIGKRILSDRAKRHVSKGLCYYTISLDENNVEHKRLLRINEIEDFLEENNVNQVQKGLAEDLETFYNAMPYFRLNLKDDAIAGYGYKKMIHCRMGEMDEGNNHIDKIYHSYLWPNPTEKQYVEIPTYDEINPLKHARFVKPIRYSTSDETLYYELAIWDSVRQNGWMEIDQLVPNLKRHIFRNQAVLKYHVKIPYDYWERKYGSDWAKMSIKAREKAMNVEMQKMDKFLSGAENSGKSFVSYYGHDPVSGKPYPGFEITAIDNKLKSDDYLPDASAAYAAICFAMGYDPTLIGAGLIDKRSSGGSGSDKRESLTNLQSSMPIDREVSLDPLRLITRINKWNDKYNKELDGGRIYWGYLDNDNTATQDQISPKDRNKGGKPEGEKLD